jgi:hypothetical protein
MTEMEDPIEIYRRSLAEIPLVQEDSPPTIRRAEVWPYPDLKRLWARVETGPFAAYPNLSFTVFDPDNTIVCTLFMVEIRESYQSITLHLRQPPRAGQRYRLEISLDRDDTLLDERTLEFDLTFKDPEQKETS